MILRVIALVLFGGALVMGLSLGWGRELGSVLFRVNPNALLGLQAGVEQYLSPHLWDGLFVPLLSVPAWTAPVAIGLLLILASALRPGRS